jgi:SAM-dependent methyltransferase
MLSKPKERDQSVSTVGTSFGQVASLYDAVRPGYPPAAVEVLLDAVAGPPRTLDVVDVGAGTGKLTELLVALGHRVTAVEPDAAMLGALTNRLPTVIGTVGTGEYTSLESASADVLVVAQAFHWMKPPAAMAEFARVLRPGGVLGLVWNIRDDRVGWVERFNALLDSAGDGTMANMPIGPGSFECPEFGKVTRHDVDHSQTLDEQRLVDLAASRSYVIALSPTDRDRFLAGVRRFAQTDPELAGRDTFEQPYVTRTYRFVRR